MNPRLGPSTRSRFSPPHLLMVAVLVLSIGGSATAAKLVTGQQIKNNSVTTKDIKNNNLRLKDFKKSQRDKLRGPAGASAFEPAASGTLVARSAILNDNGVPVGEQALLHVPLPLVTPTALTDSDIRFGATALASSLEPGAVDTTACPGSLLDPTATPGKVCIYLGSGANIPPGNVRVYAGTSAADAAAPLNVASDSLGFTIQAGSLGTAAPVRLRLVWAYRVP